MIITSDDVDSISVLKVELAKQFEMKDLSSLRYFLGIEVAYSPIGYLLSQSKYVADILKRVGLTDNKTVDTPIEVNGKCTLLLMECLCQIIHCTVLFFGAWSISRLLVLILLMMFMLLVNLLLLLLPFIGQLFVF